MESKALSDQNLATEFVTIVVEQPDSIATLPQAITRSLQELGDPLRWAITSVDSIERKLYVEAVIITSCSE